MFWRHDDITVAVFIKYIFPEWTHGPQLRYVPHNHGHILPKKLELKFYNNIKITIISKDVYYLLINNIFC